MTLVKSSRLDNGILTLSPAPHPIQPLLDGGGRAVGWPPPDSVAFPSLSCPAEGAARFDSEVDGGGPLQCAGQRLEIYPARRDSDPVRHRLPYCSAASRCQTPAPASRRRSRPRSSPAFTGGPPVREQEGLGLGLYLTRRILTSEGGYIRVSSQPGKGSTFSLYLPLE